MQWGIDLFANLFAIYLQSICKYIGKSICNLFVNLFVTIYLQIYLQSICNLSAEIDEETIKNLSQQIIKIGGKPSFDGTDQKILIKNFKSQVPSLKI